MKTSIIKQVEKMLAKPFSEKIVLVYKDKAFDVFTKKTIKVPNNIKFGSYASWNSQLLQIAANTIIDYKKNILYHKRGLPNNGYVFTRYVENKNIKGFISTTVYNDGSTRINMNNSFIIDKITEKVLTLSGRNIISTDRLYGLRRNSGIELAIKRMPNGKDIVKHFSETVVQSYWSGVWQYARFVYQKKEHLNLKEYKYGIHEIPNGFYWRSPEKLIIYQNKKMKGYAIEGNICFKKAVTYSFLSQVSQVTNLLYIPNKDELQIIARFTKITIIPQLFSQRQWVLLLMLSLMGKKIIEEILKANLQGLTENLIRLCDFYTPQKGEHLKQYLNLPYNKIRIIDELILNNKIKVDTIFRAKHANIGSLDNNLFIATLYAFESGLLRDYSGLYSYDTRNKGLGLRSNKILIKLLNIEQQHSGAFRLYKDCLMSLTDAVGHLVGNIYMTSDVFTATAKDLASSYIKDLKSIQTYQQLVDMHDDLVEFAARANEEYASRKNEIEKKRIHKLEEELQKKPIFMLRKQWQEYQNELFCIINPSYEEIKEEGKALHHCVGSYAESHLLGNTSIMCLRKKEEPKKPFYTIEIKNNTVVQIHGFANKWLGNDPEAIPFVANWLKANNINCTKNILINKAQGYMAAPEQVETQMDWSLYPNII